MSDLDTVLGSWRDSTASVTPRPELVSQLRTDVEERAKRPPAVFPELPDPMKGGAFGWYVLLASVLVLSAGTLAILLIVGA